MMAEQANRRRWFKIGCMITCTASLGLITFPLTYSLPFMSDAIVFSLIFTLTILMGLGATLAIFSLKHP